MSAKKTVLVIEDEPSIQQILVDLFSEEDCVPIAVTTGEKALEMLDLFKIDLITLDLHLIGMNGLTFLHYLSQTNKTVPVIIISANAFLVPDIYQHSTLVKSIIEKPFNIETVSNLLGDLDLAS